MLLSYSTVLGLWQGGYVLGWEDALLTENGRATIGFTSRRTARGIDRLKGTRLLDPNLHCVHLLVFRGKVTLTEESD